MKAKHTKQNKLIIKNNKLIIKNSINESIIDTTYNAGKGLVGDIGKAYEALYSAAERYVRTFLFYPFRIIKVLFTDEKLKDINKKFREKDKDLSDEMNRAINSMEGVSDAKMFLAIVKPEVLITTPAVNKINYYKDKIIDKFAPFKENVKIINNEIHLVNFFIFLYNDITNKDDIREIELLHTYSEDKQIKSTKENLKGLQVIIIKKLNEKKNIHLINEFFQNKVFDFINNKKIYDLSKDEIDFLKIIFKNNDNNPSFALIETIKKLLKISQDTSQAENNIKTILILKSKLQKILDKKKTKKEPEDSAENGSETEETTDTSDKQSSTPANTETTTSTDSIPATTQQAQNSSFSRLNINNKNIKIIYENEQKDIDNMSIEQLMDIIKHETKCHYTYLMFMNAFCGIAMNNYQMTFAFSLYAFYVELLNKLLSIDNNTDIDNIDDFDSIKKIKQLSENSILENYINEVVSKNNSYKEFLNLSIIEQQLQLNKKAINEFYNKNKEIVNNIKQNNNETNSNVLLIKIYEETIQQITKENLVDTKKLTKILDEIINLIQEIKINYDNNFIKENLKELEDNTPSGEGKIISQYRIETLSNMIKNINDLKIKLSEINISDIIDKIKEKCETLKTNLENTEKTDTQQNQQEETSQEEK